MNVRIRRFLLIPDQDYNLVLTGRLVDHCMESNFRRTDILQKLESSQHDIGTSKRDLLSGMCTQLFNWRNPMTLIGCSVSPLSSLAIRRRWLEHASAEDLKRMREHAASSKLNRNLKFCGLSKIRKAYKLPFVGHRFCNTSTVGEHVYSSIVGKLETPFPDHYSYFGTFLGGLLLLYAYCAALWTYWSSRSFYLNES